MNDYELLIQEDYKAFYNPNRIYSLQGFNFHILVGGRGIGKTTSLLIKAVKNALKRGEQFMYVRRYKVETKKLKNLLDNIIGGVTTKSMGDSGSFSYWYKGKCLGYCIALTQQQSMKSNNFPLVTMIIFDEAILLRGGTYRYLQDEVLHFLELVSTIVRLRTNYKVFIVGNNADYLNPYFEYFKVPRFENVYMDKDRGLYCEKCPTKAELATMEETTPLYKLTMGTSYGEYHYNNALLTTREIPVIKKPTDCNLYFRMIFNSITLVFWLYEEDNDYHIWVESKDGMVGENTQKYIYNDVPNYAFIKDFKQSNIFKLMRIIYWDERMCFDDEKTGQLINEIMEELK